MNHAQLEYSYEKQVYAGVLGKVIGVYLGRPFEGWDKTRIEEKWGLVDHYVHDDQGVPLVVSDDDISGTLTFVRALEDSGLYADTPEDFFGKTWLNYLLENKTILWWGGMGQSTEHTAYLRLKAGIPSPRSGSIELNGKTVAEQIGAQIFIDGFGLVCPGQPSLAAKLARKAARVSHDGEAVNAAMVVAAMEAAAFEEKDMEKLLDIGISFIPQDSLVAKLHCNVRAWCKEDGDWRKTYNRIRQVYGYDTYGGNCHVIPNHALMVMAWNYAPDDFHKALSIVNTCGWDTDCNSANVGCLMALVVGLESICRSYDFRTPFADRIILPTADGTNAVTDCLTEARRIARIGRKNMGWKEKNGNDEPSSPYHWYDFNAPGAAQGFMAEATGRGVKVAQLPATSPLTFHYSIPIGGVARISAPMLPPKAKSGYSVVGTGKLYPGMHIKVTLGDCTSMASAPTVALFLRVGGDAEAKLLYSEKKLLATGTQLEMSVPELEGLFVASLGVEVCSGETCEGTITLQCVDLLEDAPFHYKVSAVRLHEQAFADWIADYDFVRGAFSEDREKLFYLGKNQGRGYAYTGNRFWKNQSIEAPLCVHLADQAGLMCRFQGLQRYISLTRRGNRLVLAQQYYGETILAELPCNWPLGEIHTLKLVCQGDAVCGYFDGEKKLEATCTLLKDGAAGLVYENGLLGFLGVEMSGSCSCRL
ncbi:MAG: ADP-ribosylglycohydrolase family protein [Victivallales bacterium]|nr:ADP-ribosylglycohydrolase family protein [Victivallales bacterium]